MVLVKRLFSCPSWETWMAISLILCNKSILIFHAPELFISTVLMQFWHFYHTCRSVIYPSFKEPFQKHVRAGTENPCQNINLWIMGEPFCSNILSPFHVQSSLDWQHKDSQPPCFPTVHTCRVSSQKLGRCSIFLLCCCGKTLTKSYFGRKGLFGLHSMSQSIISRSQGRNLMVETVAETMKKCFSLAGFPRHVKAALFTWPRPTCPEIALPLAGLALSYQQQWRKCIRDMSTSHSGGGSCSTEIPSSQVCIGLCQVERTMRFYSS